jgi:hypothetical protein
MTTFGKHATLISVVALMTAGTAGLANAQSETYGNQDQNNACAVNPEACAPKIRKAEPQEEGVVKKRRFQQEGDQALSGEADQPRRMRQAEWKFDANRHERRRNRDKRFRFEFGGFWYPEPYWLVPGYTYGLVAPYRISCGEGRAILRDRGFNRVRTVECRGRTFTYLGRRHGDRFRVLVSSRSGRIVDVDPI